MEKESNNVNYSKLEKQLHDDFQHLDEEELNDHLNEMKKDHKYTSGNKELDVSLRNFAIFKKRT